jgi:hypothetical protein
VADFGISGVESSRSVTTVGANESFREMYAVETDFLTRISFTLSSANQGRWCTSWGVQRPFYRIPTWF